MKEAVDIVIINDLSIRNVAERKGLESDTLDIYVEKTKKT